KNIDEGKPWVLRFRSDGNEENKVFFDDIIRGKIEMPENVIDEVLLKSDGIPTYHFAHVCDDHFMRTTHVIRGEEWISSTPKHIALFKACGYRLPKYAHTPQVMKIDDEDGTKRKLSKRKDPEAAVSYFVEEGFPKEALIEYLMTLLNSNFEEWRLANPDAPIEEFKFTTKKMAVSGSLFDLDKLNDISKNVISRLTAEEVYEYTLAWAKENDKEFASILESDKAYAVRILSIGRGGKKPRKDIALWSEVKGYMSFFYDKLFVRTDAIPESFYGDDIAAVLDAFKESYDDSVEQSEWFNNIKAIAESNGFCPDMKQYKANPESYKGSVADVSMFLRVAVTGRMNSPDLYEVIQILGKERVLARVSGLLL
ncbi:MAG: glutamate--tRNA ligase, partial [Clostridia bacterium]|nr:glutamate--tRNA ligase [Clostridia bacterium]